MKKSMIVCTLLLAGHVVNSQVDVNWKTPVDGNPKSIYFHSFTQTPIAETSTNY
jgi:hypothetical protein